jgi:hypothetical protein
LAQSAIAPNCAPGTPSISPFSAILLRIHKTLGNTPAVAAGVELERWDLERVVEITSAFIRRKEDAAFEQAFAEVGI